MPDIGELEPLCSRAGKALYGRVSVPGDKSISHRALIIASSAIGETRIKGLLEGEDVLATASALSEMGVTLNQDCNGCWIVQGLGVGALMSPNNILDMGNAGTAARLLMGLIAGNPISAIITGDASLRSRPMKRVIEPLEAMGTQISSHLDNYLPVQINGNISPLPLDYKLTVPSAQVKSAILLCGLSSRGSTIIHEINPSRDHTERMLKQFGAEIKVDNDENNGVYISLNGQCNLYATELSIPGDISSAAFLIAAAVMIPNSEITVTNVGINPLRTGFLDTLLDMGADLLINRVDTDSPEPIADITARYSQLRGVSVPSNRAPTMIDEYPILAVLASVAKGRTEMHGIRELRYKESDRIATTVSLLNSAGVEVNEFEDGFSIEGNGKPAAGGVIIETALDHRIAMAALVMGLTTDKPIRINDSSPISTSFPTFVNLMKKLGAEINNPA